MTGGRRNERATRCTTVKAFVDTNVLVQAYDRVAESEHDRFRLKSEDEMNKQNRGYSENLLE